ncbi:MAG TPA: hypothetical protein VLZ72_09890 [Flavobacterium sp.]|nr:hypothetical protein [Flavobacterium sp.]
MNKTKEVLFADEKAITNEKKVIETGFDLLNQAIREAESLLNAKLSGKQKMEIVENGRTFVQNELRKKYQFKNADDDFNLQAMGVNPEPLYGFLKTNAIKWQSVDFEADKDEIKLSEVQPLIERHTYYLETERQKEALEIAQKLADVLNEANEKGFVTGNFSEIRKCISILDDANRHDVKPLFFINKEYIGRSKKL